MIRKLITISYSADRGQTEAHVYEIEMVRDGLNFVQTTKATFFAAYKNDRHSDADYQRLVTGFVDRYGISVREVGLGSYAIRHTPDIEAELREAWGPLDLQPA